MTTGDAFVYLAVIVLSSIGLGAGLALLGGIILDAIRDADDR